MTLVCTASGMSLFKLGAPVWGLGLGLLMLMLERTRYKKTSSVANTQSNDT